MYVKINRKFFLIKVIFCYTVLNLACLLHLLCVPKSRNDAKALQKAVYQYTFFFFPSLLSLSLLFIYFSIFSILCRITEGWKRPLRSHNPTIPHAYQTVSRVSHLHISWWLPGTVTVPPPLAAYFNASPLFLWRIFFLISYLNLSWCNWRLLPLVLSLPGRGGWLPPCHSLHSRNCREQ